MPYLILLFASLSATGALAEGVSGIAKAISDAKVAKKLLSHKHNKTMEAIALSKGLFLKPYKKDYGLYLKPYSGGSFKKKEISKSVYLTECFRTLI